MNAIRTHHRTMTAMKMAIVHQRGLHAATTSPVHLERRPSLHAMEVPAGRVVRGVPVQKGARATPQGRVSLQGGANRPLEGVVRMVAGRAARGGGRAAGGGRAGAERWPGRAERGRERAERERGRGEKEKVESSRCQCVRCVVLCSASRTARRNLPTGAMSPRTPTRIPKAGASRVAPVAAPGAGNAGG